jgi:hypothetical protein
MGTYGLDGVIGAWKIGTLTTEQAVGQILQLLQELEKRMGDLERRAVHSTHPVSTPSSPSKPRRRRKTPMTHE